MTSCVLALFLCATPTFAQDNAITLKGAIDIHVHSDPDSAPRVIDADDVARQAKAAGMRAVVLKNHWAETASLAYMVRKIVPGFEAFGGLTQDIAMGGLRLGASLRGLIPEGRPAFSPPESRVTSPANLPWPNRIRSCRSALCRRLSLPPELLSLPPQRLPRM